MAVNLTVLPLADIEIPQRCGRLVVDLQSVFDGLKIVVGTAGLLAALYHAVNKLLFRNLQPKHMMNLNASPGHKAVKRFGLRDCARKTIENNTLLGFRLIVDNLFQNPDHQ